MRALILSDIHSNLEALTTVLDDAAGRGGFDVLWCLGDLVGYGPDPGACLQLIGGYSLLGVTGNHDLAAVGKRSADDFNSAANAAIRWTAGPAFGGGNRFSRRSAHYSHRPRLHPGARQPAGACGRIPSGPGCRSGYIGPHGDPVLPGGPLPHSLPLPRERRLALVLPVYRGRDITPGPGALDNQPGMRGPTPGPGPAPQLRNL